MWRTVCCIDLICYNGSVWAWMGYYSSKRFGAHHSCTVQLLAWLDVLQEDRLARTKAGDGPPLTVLETVALPVSLRGQVVLQTIQELRGQTQLVVCCWLCLFALWSWLAWSWLSPGSPLLPAGMKVFWALYVFLQMPGRRQSPRVRHTDLLAAQPSCWSWPKPAGQDLSVVTGHLRVLYPALRPLAPVVETRFAADGRAISLSRVLISCWAVNTGNFTNCDYFQQVKPDFSH